MIWCQVTWNKARIVCYSLAVEVCICSTNCSGSFCQSMALPYHLMYGHSTEEVSHNIVIM